MQEKDYRKRLEEKQYLIDHLSPAESWRIFRIMAEFVDAIDTLSPKIALICTAMENKIPLVSSMGAGAKRDATMVRLSDISQSYNCPLAFMLRKRLRKMGIRKGFQVVFSTELPDTRAIIPCEEKNKKSQVGTISYLPAVFGCVCAQAAIDYLCLSND